MNRIPHNYKQENIFALTTSTAPASAHCTRTHMSTRTHMPTALWLYAENAYAKEVRTGCMGRVTTKQGLRESPKCTGGVQASQVKSVLS